MSKWIPVLVAGLVGALAAAAWASSAGIGLQKPMKKPVSIREGSSRTGHSGHRYRHGRYFVGGGTFRGK